MDRPMELLGNIVRLQIQRSSLKAGQKLTRYYDPAPLLAQQEMILTHAGAQVAQDGQMLLDIHNAAHPNSKNRDGVNSLSIGFTSYYTHMREQYGTHLTDGIAGENILVDSAQPVTLDDLSNGIVIRRATDGMSVPLGSVSIARPCVEFSHYALQRPPGGATADEIKQTLQALDGGVRGFYCSLGIAGPVTVALGDAVYALK